VAALPIVGQLGGETDAAARRVSWPHEFADCREDRGEGFVLSANELRPVTVRSWSLLSGHSQPALSYLQRGTQEQSSQ
jgi:hypothetical protein